MPKETFKKFDIATLLEDEEDVAGYLQAVIDESGDDASTITHALGVAAYTRPSPARAIPASPSY